MERKLLSGAALAWAALVLTSCGSSSSGPQSAEQLAGKVNAACVKYRKASTAIPQPADFVSNPASAAAYLERLRPLVESEHATIAALEPKAALRARFDRFKTASTHQLGLFESALAKARAGDSGGLRDLLVAARYKQSVMLPLERSLGLMACER
jgi:hypothetical protein